MCAGAGGNRILPSVERGPGRRPRALAAVTRTPLPILAQESDGFQGWWNSPELVFVIFRHAAGEKLAVRGVPRPHGELDVLLIVVNGYGSAAECPAVGLECPGLAQRR